MWVLTHRHTCTYAHTCPHGTHVHVHYTHAHAHTAYICTHACTQICSHAQCMHGIHMLTCLCTWHTYAHMQCTCTWHPYVHTCTHTIHMYMYSARAHTPPTCHHMHTGAHLQAHTLPDACVGATPVLPPWGTPVPLYFGCALGAEKALACFHWDSEALWIAELCQPHPFSPQMFFTKRTLIENIKQKPKRLSTY